MKTFNLTESVKLEARNIATAVNYNSNVERKFHRNYTPLNVNWQGAIAEVQLAKLFPELKSDIVYNSDMRESSFIYEGKEIEVQCNIFYRMYPFFFINKERFDKKKESARFLIACGINAEPEKAAFFYLFGYLESKKIIEYPVNSKYDVYSVPIKDFENLDILMRPFSLTNYMRK